MNLQFINLALAFVNLLLVVIYLLIFGYSGTPITKLNWFSISAVCFCSFVCGMCLRAAIGF